MRHLPVSCFLGFSSRSLSVGQSYCVLFLLFKSPRRAGVCYRVTNWPCGCNLPPSVPFLSSPSFKWSQVSNSHTTRYLGAANSARRPNVYSSFRGCWSLRAVRRPPEPCGFHRKVKLSHGFGFCLTQLNCFRFTFYLGSDPGAVGGVTWSVNSIDGKTPWSWLTRVVFSDQFSANENPGDNLASAALFMVTQGGEL